MVSQADNLTLKPAAGIPTAPDCGKTDESGLTRLAVPAALLRTREERSRDATSQKRAANADGSERRCFSWLGTTTDARR